MARLFERLERFYDTVPRAEARVEEFGSLVLFVRSGGQPGYARPLGCPTAADLAAVRERQRELGVPEAFEWVHETTPSLLPLVREAGFGVQHAPLMVLDPTGLPSPGAAKRARLLDPEAASFAADLAVRRAIADVGFSCPGTLVGAAGAPARDAAVRPVPAEDLALELAWHRAGRLASALAPVPVDPSGPLSSGLYQRVDGVAEVAGVATVPAGRRTGLGSAVTAVLARHAWDNGADLVFLTAGSEEIARVYARVGFCRVGTACIAEPGP
jgi:hypothetical protein